MKKYSKPELELLAFRTEPVLEDTANASVDLGDNELPPVFTKSNNSRMQNWFTK